MLDSYNLQMSYDVSKFLIELHILLQLYLTKEKILK